jgi:hypothetical protein
MFFRMSLQKSIREGERSLHSDYPRPRSRFMITYNPRPPPTPSVEYNPFPRTLLPLSDFKYIYYVIYTVHGNIFKLNILLLS